MAPILGDLRTEARATSTDKREEKVSVERRLWL